MSWAPPPVGYQDFSDFRVGDRVRIRNEKIGVITRIGRGSDSSVLTIFAFCHCEEDSYELGWWASSLELLEHDKEYEEAVAVFGEDYFA